MVLADSLFEWFYDEGFPAHAQIGNISGGTDLAACFAMDNPLSPLYVGGCQGAGLGIPIAVFEQVDEGLQGVDGKPAPDGEAGELVATGAFPTMPVTFWGDDGSKKYSAAYFERYNSKPSPLLRTQSLIGVKVSGRTETSSPSTPSPNK
jgi:acetoacetyl-CoA synthetase